MAKKKKNPEKKHSVKKIGRGSEKTFFQRRRTDDQQVHEHVLNREMQVKPVRSTIITCFKR